MRRRYRPSARSLSLPPGIVRGPGVVMADCPGARPAPGGESLGRDSCTTCHTQRHGMALPTANLSGQVWERAKETRKPLTVISPMARWASSNASGIIVSAIMARIAPAATAVTAAITAGEKEPTTV